MRTPSPELVIMTRTLGHQLTSLREAAGIVQQQVARKTGYSRSSVAKAEAGRQLLTREFWQTADELLKAEGALLASYERVRAAKQEHEATSRAAELAEAYAQAQADAEALRAANSTSPAGPGTAAEGATPADEDRAEGSGELTSRVLPGSVAGEMPADREAEVRDRLVSLLREWISGMNRRELIELLGQAAAIISAPTMMAGLNTDEVERLTRAVVSPSRVDNKVIDHIEAIFRYCKRREDTLGPRAVLNTAIAEQNLVHDLLSECPTALRPRLLSVYSDMSTSIGYYYFDLDDAESAMHYWDQARSAAQNAKNTELGIYVLGYMHYAAARQGKNYHAIDLAAAAQSLAHKTGDPHMRVDATLMAARSYALDEQYTACLVEFDKAMDTLRSLGEPSAESPLYWCHEGILARKRSECLLLLKRPREAAACARIAMTFHDNSDNVDSLAACALNLSDTLVQCDEVDEAAHVLGDVAGLVAQIRSVRLAKELHTTRTRMQPWQDTRAVKELDSHLENFGFSVRSA